MFVLLYRNVILLCIVAPGGGGADKEAGNYTCGKTEQILRPF